MTETGLEAMSETAAPLPLAGFLTRAATLAPDRPALAEGEAAPANPGLGRSALSYRDLDARVAELARALTASGAGPGSVIAVCLPRSVGAAIAIHAAVRLGAVVAPLDPRDPPARLRAMLRTAAAEHLVIDRAQCARLALDPVAVTANPGGGPTGVIARLGPSPGQPALANPSPASPPAASPSPARQGWAAHGGYLLFTSGSTGTPKGVLLSLAAVAHFAAWAARATGLGPDDRVCAQAALTFDLSTFDLFSTAYACAAAVLLPEWLKPFPTDTAEWLTQNAITTIYAVPTLLRGLVGSAAPLPTVRRVIYAGEPYPPQALAALLRRLPTARVFNFYGPTETNVCTFTEVSSQWEVGTPVPIGVAIAGVWVELAAIDPSRGPGERQGEGGNQGLDEGELVVAGPTLLTGYLIDGRLVDPTVPLRFGDGVTRRAYRTGDRAVAGPAGQLLLRGRSDAQIKRRGYRLDLTGIERIVAEVPAVRAAAAAAYPDSGAGIGTDTGTDTDTDVKVVLYVEAELTPTAESEVASAIDKALPVTHHPDRTVWVDRIPRNSRGKIDYPRLGPIAYPTAPQRKE